MWLDGMDGSLNELTIRAPIGANKIETILLKKNNIWCAWLGLARKQPSSPFLGKIFKMGAPKIFEKLQKMSQNVERIWERESCYLILGRKLIF